MILDSGDAITAGHVAGLAHGNPELIDISTLKVQHRRSPFQNGRPARFPADPIVHPAFAVALGVNESEKLSVSGMHETIPNFKFEYLLILKRTLIRVKHF